jgi:hypothetical protein
MRRSILSHIKFVWLHPFLVYAMLLATVGLVMGYHAIKYGDDSDLYFNRMLAIGAFWVLVLFAFMRASHKGIIRCWSNPSTALHFFVRIALGFAHLGMWWYEGDPVVPMAAHAAISVVVNVIDIYVALRIKNKGMTESEVLSAPPAIPSSMHLGRRPSGGSRTSIPSKLFPGRRIWKSGSLEKDSDASSLSSPSDSANSPFNHDKL